MRARSSITLTSDAFCRLMGPPPVLGGNVAGVACAGGAEGVGPGVCVTVGAAGFGAAGCAAGGCACPAGACAPAGAAAGGFAGGGFCGGCANARNPEGVTPDDRTGCVLDSAL